MYFDINQVRYNTFCVNYPHLKKDVDEIFSSLRQPKNCFEMYPQNRYNVNDANALKLFFNRLGYWAEISHVNLTDEKAWKLMIRWF